MDRKKESKLKETLEEIEFEIVDGHRISPSKNLYHPREFDLSELSSSLSPLLIPQEKTDAIIHLKYSAATKQYVFEVYKPRNFSI
jgi:hypothetical protein